ncbi:MULTISPECIES: TrbI/VirB10 family protein [Luteibacter]|uniref:TrbI/VirB10 family protein n=1 Tax=Luteibacter TaxID=242605 RepID=UPI00056BC8BE|nr:MULTISPECIES: TrbI/VirB10 family protein [unclassified Luteibacter]MDR6644124.1 type IV secretion system protein VirB10 [Luteibacter sp. 1214]
MTPNNPYHPDDENQAGHVPPHEGVGDRPDPLASNPYSQQRQQAPQPDLDAGAPTLAANDVRRMNRRALVFLAGIIVLLLTAGYLLLSGGSSKQQVVEKPREEQVNVPEAPRVMPTPALPNTENRAQPIALAPPPPLPTPEQLRPASMPEASRGPTLLERRIMAANDAAQIAGNANGGGGGQAGGGPQGFMGGAGIPGFPGGPLPNNGVPVNSAYGAKELADVSSAEPLTHPDTLMLRGTFIRCVLETRIITDIPGFTSCVVTEPVYSFTGKRLLLPKGSKVLGKYEMEPNGPRVAVIWDRVVTPTGIDVKMASPGIDTLGGAGHPGYYNAHWGSRIGSALLISLFSDAFKYEAAEHGPKQTTISNGVVTQNPFESNTAMTIQQIANSAVQRAANRPATVTINQGTVLAIYVAKDVDFSGVVARY